MSWKTGKDCEGPAPVRPERLIRTKSVCSGKDQATVLLMRGEQWGPRRAAFRDSAENGKQQKAHGDSGFAPWGKVQALLGVFEPGQIDGVHQK